MLSKERRLNRSIFNKVRSSPLVLRGPRLSLRFICTNAQSAFSVVVPKSATLKAVGRNLLRRRAYNILQSHKNGLFGIVYLQSAKISHAELLQGIGELLQKATNKCFPRKG